MSQGIMEKNLPVAESIQSGDKIRIVTSAGNSKQVDASAVGGALKVTITSEEVADGTLYSTDKTYNQIANAESVMFVMADSEVDAYYVGSYQSYGYVEGMYMVIVVFSIGNTNETLMLTAESADEVLTYLKMK